MSSGVSKLSVSLLLAGLMSVAMTHADAQQPTSRRAPKIEFTEPGTTTISTNAAEPASKKPNSKLRENAVRKPLDFFDLDDSFSGVPAPSDRNSRQTRPQTKREREQIERKKNWVFNTPEEALGVASPEDMLDVPELEPGADTKAVKSSFERYLLRMEKARTEGATNNVKSEKVAEAQKVEEAEARENSQKEDKAEDRAIFAFGQASANRAVPGTDFTGTFEAGPGRAEKNFKDWFNTLSADANSKPAPLSSAQSQRNNDTFKRLLETRSLASPGLGTGYDLDSSRSPSASSSLQSSFSSILSGRDSLSPQPAPRPSSLPTLAPTTSLPNSFSPSYAPAFNPAPTWTAPRTFPAPATGFELPQRKF